MVMWLVVTAEHEGHVLPLSVELCSSSTLCSTAPLLDQVVLPRPAETTWGVVPQTGNRAPTLSQGVHLMATRTMHDDEGGMESRKQRGRSAAEAVAGAGLQHSHINVSKFADSIQFQNSHGTNQLQNLHIPACVGGRWWKLRWNTSRGCLVFYRNCYPGISCFAAIAATGPVPGTLVPSCEKNGIE